MARSNNWEVVWSPVNANKFVKFNQTDNNSEITLYNVFQPKDSFNLSSNRNQIKLSEDSYASVAGVCNEFSSIKSIAWCPAEQLKDTCAIAVGSSNGHVSLATVGMDSASKMHSQVFNTEFVPKADRPCNDLAWSKLDPSLLAVGLDKVRYENSLLVWSVESVKGGAGAGSADNRQSPMPKPYFEHASSESTISVTWLPSKPKTIIASQHPKWLRLYDLRSKNPTVLVSTKHIYGLVVDPFFPDHFASFAEGAQGAVLVWDIRSADKPIVTINQSRPVSKILWCPTRSNMISVLHKDSAVVKSYDLQHTLFGSSMQYANNLDEDNESIIFERNFQLPKPKQSTLSSFDWHPTNESTILTVSNQGVVNALRIFERITMSWSPSLDLVWGCGRHMLMLSKNDLTVEDISLTMKQRAKNGYGDKALLKDEKRLGSVLQDRQLLRIWVWLRRVRARPKDIPKDSRKGRMFFGVKGIIKGDMNNRGKATQSLVQEDSTIATKQYASEDRRAALHLCSWDLTEQGLCDRLNYLCDEGEEERAAANALFHKRISWAIDILSGQKVNLKKTSNGSQSKDPAVARAKPIDPMFPVVAMALSGYSEDKKSNWAEMCRNLSMQLGRAYLRAMFAFLTAENDEFVHVLRESEMNLPDRIAFACKYLSDTRLVNYIDEITQSMIDEGNLEGLLLTGLTPDGVDLLENYITKTSDVQTAVLLILTSKVSEVYKDSRVSAWIDNYEDLLDQWGLWHERALFDSLVQANDTSRKPSQQISVSCIYCGKAISSSFFQPGMRMQRFPHMGATSGTRPSKASACPGCRQPLPRCSICLLNMGSLSSHTPKSGGGGPTKPQKLDNIVNNFMNWFTWCQNCRHGGHASHLCDWFSEHVVCPVTGCNCICNGQDCVAEVLPKDDGTLEEDNADMAQMLSTMAVEQHGKDT